MGATTAYALMMGGTVSEIVLVDLNKKRLEGRVMDLNHGIAFVPPVRIGPVHMKTALTPILS